MGFRAFISYVLIIVVAMVSCRYIVFNSYVRTQKHEFRKKALEQNIAELKMISCDSKQLFKSRPGLEWKKHNKELVINGIYHEVLRTETRGNVAYIYVIPDKEESNLFNTYFTSEKNKSTNASICSLLLNVFMMFESNRLCFALYTNSIYYHPLNANRMPEFKGNELLKPPTNFRG